MKKPTTIKELAIYAAKARWAKTTKEERTAHAVKMNKAKADKNYPQGDLASKEEKV
jgi:hypothetical protein